jgi:type I restriction enzyme, S subunit
MKQGWGIKKLGEVCRFINGRAYSQHELLKDGKYPVLRVGNFYTNRDWYYSDLELPEDKYCENGDLLYAWSASFGPKIWEGEKVIYHYHIWKVIPDTNIVTKEFLFQLLEWDTEALKTAHGTGTTMMHVGKGSIEKRLVPIPPLPEQQRIVSILDEAFAVIERSRNAAIKNLKNAKELFESYLQGVFENGNWETKTIEKVCDEIFAGGDAPKNNYSLEPNEKHNIPIYANAVKDRGLYGYTDFARVTKPCVTIAARGSGTGHTELRNEHFLPIVRLIVCIPDTEQISNEFLKYTIDNLVIQRSGSAIPQLTVPMIKDYKIPVPSIEEQKLIIEKAETLKQQKENLESVYLQKIEGLEELKKSILQKAFAGELRGGEPVEPKTEKAVAV